MPKLSLICRDFYILVDYTVTDCVILYKPQLKWYLDRFIHFCRAHGCAQQTADGQTGHATSVIISRIRAGDAPNNNNNNKSKFR